MVNQWLRWYHGTVEDAKFRVISRKTGIPVATIVGVWAALMENASKNESTRGTLDGWDPEDMAEVLGISASDLQMIRDAMEGKTLAGDVLAAWDKRNPKREDDTAAERAQRKRDRDKITHSHAASRSVTQSHNREDKKREEKIPSPVDPPNSQSIVRPIKPEQANDSIERAFKAVLGHLRGNVVPEAYKRLYAPIEVRSVSSEFVILAVPQELIDDWDGDIGDAADSLKQSIELSGTDFMRGRKLALEVL